MYAVLLFIAVTMIELLKFLLGVEKNVFVFFSKMTLTGDANFIQSSDYVMLTCKMWHIKQNNVISSTSLYIYGCCRY